MELDLTSGSLLALAIFSGNETVELLNKGIYPFALAFLIITGVFVFAREYFKIS